MTNTAASALFAYGTVSALELCSGLR